MGYTIAFARTNYFRVADEKAFRLWATACEYKVSEHDGMFKLFLEPEDGHISVEAAEDFLSSGQGIADSKSHEGDEGDEDECDDDGEDRELLPEIAKFLQPGSIAALFWVAGDSYGDVFGHATAVNSAGVTLELSLTDILKKAATDLGGEAKD